MYPAKKSYDPAGFGQEHTQIQSAVQLRPAEIRAVQVGTQKAYDQALDLFVPRQKYFWNGFRGVLVGPSTTNAAASALMYPPPSHTSLSAANLSVAAFLVARGPYSFQLGPANQAIIEGQDRTNPFF